jgi:hypothetical protein
MTIFQSKPDICVGGVNMHVLKLCPSSDIFPLLINELIRSHVNVFGQREKSKIVKLEKEDRACCVK